MMTQSAVSAVRFGGQVRVVLDTSQADRFRPLMAATLDRFYRGLSSDSQQSGQPTGFSDTFAVALPDGVTFLAPDHKTSKLKTALDKALDAMQLTPTHPPEVLVSNG